MWEDFPGLLRVSNKNSWALKNYTFSGFIQTDAEEWEWEEYSIHYFSGTKAKKHR